MKVYQVTKRRSGTEHDGYSYFANKTEAQKEQNKENKANYASDSVVQVNFTLSKKGIINLLNIWAAYSDNG